jgi:hypothetical protein
VINLNDYFILKKRVESSNFVFDFFLGKTERRFLKNNLFFPTTLHKKTLFQKIIRLTMKFSILLFLSIFSIKNAFSQQYADCSKAMDICKKAVYHIESARGEGNDPYEATEVPCFENGEVKGNAEMNSVWFHLKIKKSGTLTFAMTPHRFDDDLDFVLFRLMGGDCEEKIIVRCMASGDQDFIASPCMGETGLRAKEVDSFEDAGCADDNDNAWLAPQNVKKDEEYALLVSNVTSHSVGFSIRFGGSCMLPCDEIKKKIIVPPPPPPAIRPEIIVETTPIKELEPPKNIGKQAIVVEKTIEVTSGKLQISLSDDEVVDGDVVSLWVNDKKVVARVELVRVPKVFNIELSRGVNFITVHAEEFGMAAVNTTGIIIDDGKTKQSLHLTARPGKEESLKIIWTK